MPVPAVRQRGVLLCAVLCRIAAACAERAARRHVQRTRHISGEHDALALARDLGIRHRHSRQQGLRIRVHGVVVQLVCIGDLDKAAQIHDGNALGDMVNDQQVMRDKQIRDAKLFLKLFKHVDDLRLNRHIQCRYRLVADYELRVDRKRPCDADTLALAAGKFVRIARGVLGIQADCLHQA